MRICAYAFATTALFFGSLIRLCRDRGDEVEWSVVLPQWHFRDAFDGLIPASRRCYLYDRFDAHYAACGPEEIERALACSEGLVTALMKDKDGYIWLDKDEQLRRGAAIHETYREFLERVRPDFVLFPDVEAVDGFVLMNLCRAMGIGVLCYTGMRLLGRGFFSAGPYEAPPPYFGSCTAADLQAARAQIRNFQDGRAIGPGDGYPGARPPLPSWFRRIVVSEYMTWRYERRHVSEGGLYIRIRRNLRPLVKILHRRRFDAFQARYFDVRGAADPLPPRYIYCALHHTPESSINGLAPYYVDQTRIIDALLLALPAGHRLLVKEHPTMYGRRRGGFYRALRRRPGLVLVHPRVDSRRLIAQAAAVATVTGSVGLEAFLMDRPCVLFGSNFFAHLCHAAPPLPALGDLLGKLVAAPPQSPEAQKEIAIARLLNVGADFLISDPWICPTVTAPENVAAARDYLWRHLERLRQPAPSFQPMPEIAPDQLLQQADIGSEMLP